MVLSAEGQPDIERLAKQITDFSLDAIKGLEHTEHNAVGTNGVAKAGKSLLMSGR